MVQKQRFRIDKLEDTIKLFKKYFHFEDVIFILRGKTTSRRIKK